jgi:hypothetical protein
VIKVSWKSRILGLIQSRKKDNDFQAFQDIHNGLLAVKQSVESASIQSETPFGATDGTNTTFDVSEEPAFVIVNGVTKINGVDFTYIGGKVRFFTAPTSAAVIRSIHL